jgi:hypothetical protein
VLVPPLPVLFPLFFPQPVKGDVSAMLLSQPRAVGAVLAPVPVMIVVAVPIVVNAVIAVIIRSQRDR